jgi:hypothetical protein
MATTMLKSPNNLELTFASGSDTWDCKDYFPFGMCLHSIKMKGTAGDIVVFRNGGTTTTMYPRICYMQDVAGQGVKDSFSSAKIGGDKIYRFPVFCGSECTVTSWATFVVMIEYEL